MNEIGIILLILGLLFLVRHLRGQLSPDAKALVAVAGVAINLGVV